MAQERAAMRAYVTGADHLQYTQLADGMVQVNATHSNLKQYVMELRLDLHTCIGEVKRKLYTHNGTGIEHMELHLQDSAGNVICRMLDDNRALGYYGVQNGMTIHVVDTDPFSLSRDGGLDDVSKVQKYRMADEDYDKRENTLRAYKKKMLAQDPNFKFFAKKDGNATQEDATPYLDISCCDHIKQDMRCEVHRGARRGQVKYIGTVDCLAAGYWVGVHLDEPLGLGDGSRGKKKYFDCPDKHGLFIRPDQLSVGEFPSFEDELLESLEINETDNTTATTTTATSTSTSTSNAPVSTAPTAAPRALKSLNRKGGRRGDEDNDDDNDDEL